MDIFSELTRLNFQLKDCGNYWQTSALFRGGDNPTAIQIFKDSGVWIDYARDAKPRPLKVLFEMMGKNCDDVASLNTSAREPNNSREERFKVPKLYDQSILSRLLPHYDFYLKKGINKDTLSLYRAGLATSGQMYQRLVFPIFNEYKKIQGFSGRIVVQSDKKPKWKHIGKKTGFLYPFYMVDESGNNTMNDSCVDFSSSAFLVESIGDSLNMSQNGLKNHFVTFGIKISGTIISKLIELNPKKIFISFNNDELTNFAGQKAALNAFISLCSVFHHSKICVALPLKKDFGEMTPQDFSLFNKNLTQINTSNSVYDICNKLKMNNVLDSGAYQKIKQICPQN